MGTHKEKMTNTRALDIVIQQLLGAEYAPPGVYLHELRSDVRGVLGLRAACKQLADHEARQWMRDMVRCVIKNLEQVRAELMELLRARCGEDWKWMNTSGIASCLKNP